MLSSGRRFLQFRLGFCQEDGGFRCLWFGELVVVPLARRRWPLIRRRQRPRAPFVERLETPCGILMILEQALSCTVQPGMPYGAHGDIGGRWASGIGRAERGTINREREQSETLSWWMWWFSCCCCCVALLASKLLAGFLIAKQTSCSMALSDRLLTTTPRWCVL